MGLELGGLSLQKKKIMKGSRVVVEIDFGWIFVCILLLFNSMLFFYLIYKIVTIHFKNLSKWF